MKKKPLQPDSRQIDIFEMIGGPRPAEVMSAPAAETKTTLAEAKKAKNNADKDSLKQLLGSLKEIEQLLRENA